MMADRASIEVAAIVFAESKRGSAFTAREFADFLAMAGAGIHEERADEILCELVEGSAMRQIGPGVFAAKAEAAGPPVPLEQPLWPEDAPRPFQ